MTLPEGLRRVLHATDFSRGSDAALAWAMAIASAHDAVLTIVHGVAPVPRANIALDLQSAVEQRLADLAEHARREGVETETMFDFGLPWEIVAQAEMDREADLVVLGSRGHTPTVHLRLGRVADRVIRLTRGPVLTVHPGDACRPIRTALAAIDFSEASVAAAWAARRLLGASAGATKRLVLLHACHAPTDYAVGEMAGLVAGDIMEVEPRRVVAEKLDALAGRLRTDDVTVESVSSEGYATSSIEAVAIDRHVDLIAVGTSGRSGLGRVLLGSIAERTLHHAPCPVLTVRSAASRAGTATTGETAVATRPA